MQLTADEKELMKLKDLLNSTDWYIIRKLEANVDIPSDITSARAAARVRISELEEQ